jgi:hypothetical protein
LTRNATGQFTFTHNTDFSGGSKTFELENRTGQSLLNGVSVYFLSREPLGSIPPDSLVEMPIMIHLAIDATINGYTIGQARNVALEIGTRIFNSPGQAAALSDGRVALYDLGAQNEAAVLLTGHLQWHFQAQPRWADLTIPSEGGAHLVLTLGASYRA